MGKKILNIVFSFALLAFASSAQAAEASLRDVVVLFDPVKGDFHSELYQSMLGEFGQMKMHQSCPRIRVQAFRTVQCVINSKIIELGTIGNKNGVDGSITGYSVKWSRKVELIKTRDSIDGSVYSLKVQ